MLEILTNEKKTRINSEEEMVSLLKEMTTKAKAEIDKEKKERETSEETILTLLEGACSKVNSQ